jgi:hypothetical protein
VLHFVIEFRELKKIESIHQGSYDYYYEPLRNGIFTTAYYYEEYGKIYRIGLEKSYSKDNILSINNDAREIIKTCTNKYGNNYTILDIHYSGYTLPGLIWEVPSGYILLLYSEYNFTTNELKIKRKDYFIQITYCNKNLWEKETESVKFTKKYLGIE